MTKKIFRSICLVAICVVLSVMAIIMGVMYNYYSDLQAQRLDKQVEYVADAVELNGEEYLKSIKDNSIRMTWIAKDGTVLYDNEASSDQMENHLEREEVKQAMATGKGSSQRYSKTLTQRQYYSAVRLNDGSVMRMSVKELTWWALLLSMIQPIIIVFLVALLVSFLFAYSLSKKIVEPLNKIDLDSPSEAKVYEELTPLVKRIEVQQKQIKNQQLELEKKRNEFDAATENMSEGIILLNSNGVIISINKMASKLLGISTFCVGKDLLLFSSGVEIQELLRKAEAGKHSEVILPIDNVNYHFNATPIFSGDKVTGIALIIFDFTEMEKAEEVRREFTANVSHELRTPLQTIAGSSELLSNGMVAADDVPKFASRINKEAKRLIALVEDIIKLSHLDEESSGIVSEKIDLLEVAKMTAINLTPVAQKADVEINVSGEPSIVTGKSELLTSIVYNLCDNAIKYNRKGGRVDVEVKSFIDCVKLSVSDTGIGIPIEQQSRIFERFYRVDKSRSKEVGGTGLGLSIVKHAAKLHNAEIEVRSIVDKGTTIIVTFPK